MKFRIIGFLILAFSTWMVSSEGFAVPYPFRAHGSSALSEFRLETGEKQEPANPPVARKSADPDQALIFQALPQDDPPDETENKTDSSFILRKVEEWRESVLNHNPGEADEAAVTIGEWDQEDLEIVIDFLTKLADRSEKSIRRTIARAPIRNRLRLTSQEVQKGDLNRILKQGALLHTDIALLGLERGKSTGSKERTVAFIDGRAIVLPDRIHLDLARSLIDEIAPSPSEDPMARQWYIATTAFMQSQRQLDYAGSNIDSALDIYSNDPKILLCAGVLHETWASPKNQNTQLSPRYKVSYGSPKNELKKAEKFYRKVLDISPDSAEAHLRLGRVLGLQGKNPKAIAELQRADKLIQDPQLSYYVSLFLGRELEAASRTKEAKELYERAALLYPNAQSPLLALSQLARNNDDTESAILAVRSVFALPRENTVSDDPLWIYDLSHVRDAPSLIEDLYRTFGDLPQ